MIQSLMTTRTHVTEADYLRLALAEPDAWWEWLNGEMWEKPTGMSIEHNDSLSVIGYFLNRQLEIDAYRVRINSTRTARPGVSYFVPDIAVIPIALYHAHPRGALEVYSTPLPLVVEVWSPSTRTYDIETKLPEYQRRGDEEIWFVDATNQVVTVFTRQIDGAYTEQTYRPGDELRPVALSGVVIPVADVFTTV